MNSSYERLFEFLVFSPPLITFEFALLPSSTHVYPLNISLLVTICINNWRIQLIRFLNIKNHWSTHTTGKCLSFVERSYLGCLETIIKPIFTSYEQTNSYVYMVCSRKSQIMHWNIIITYTHKMKRFFYYLCAHSKLTLVSHDSWFLKDIKWISF